jgi:hypothetical protein
MMKGGIDDEHIDDNGIDVIAYLYASFLSSPLYGLVVLKIYQWRWHNGRAMPWVYV